MISNLRVEDITFKNARRQSEILKEIEPDSIKDTDEVEAPVSLTPEQVKNYYLECIINTTDTAQKRVYQQTVRWIDDMLKYKAKVNEYIAKEIKLEQMKETPEDI